MLEIFYHWRKELRIRYLGLIEVRGVRQFCFHDLEPTLTSASRASSSSNRP